MEEPHCECILTAVQVVGDQRLHEESFHLKQCSVAINARDAFDGVDLLQEGKGATISASEVYHLRQQVKLYTESQDTCTQNSGKETHKFRCQTKEYSYTEVPQKVTFSTYHILVYEC